MKFYVLQERDITIVINAMSDALCRRHPKERYLEATRWDTTIAYCVRFLPTILTMRLRLFIRNQLLNFYGQFLL